MDELYIGMTGRPGELERTLEAQWMETLNERVARMPENYNSVVMESYEK